MQSGQPSRTALSVAYHRAEHQMLEQGSIFNDPFALRILGTMASRAPRPKMRIFIACRHRFAEDALAAAIARGVTQVVVLCAGLDTWAYRNTNHGIRVFEVDHPSTQAWKRERLAEADIAIPDSLTFAPIDFERDTLADGLAAAGFDRDKPTFFTWLGVVPYLTEEAIWSTLGFIASLPNGGHVVFDYSNPPDSFSEDQRAMHERRAARVADLGEDWLTFFETAELHARLLAIGFTQIEDLGPREIAERYFRGRADSMPEFGGHILRAST
jgi:methyltransferase (TIGR00027 family)